MSRKLCVSFSLNEADSKKNPIFSHVIQNSISQKKIAVHCSLKLDLQKPKSDSPTSGGKKESFYDDYFVGLSVPQSLIAFCFVVVFASLLLFMSLFIRLSLFLFWFIIFSPSSLLICRSFYCTFFILKQVLG